MTQCLLHQNWNQGDFLNDFQSSKNEEFCQEPLYYISFSDSLERFLTRKVKNDDKSRKSLLI